MKTRKNINGRHGTEIQVYRIAEVGQPVYICSRDPGTKFDRLMLEKNAAVRLAFDPPILAA